MADLAIDLEATDLFSLGGNFHVKKSSSIWKNDAAMIMDSKGNEQCETMYGGMTDYEADYDYCNAVPAIGTDLATYLSTFGNVFNSKIITELTINFVAAQYASVSIKGHNHDAAAHAAGVAVGYCDFSALVPTGAGFGVPTFTGVTLGSNASPIEATLTFKMTHVDKIGTAGAHIVGKNITPRAEVTVKYQGVPSVAQPMTGWTTDTYGGDDANTDFDAYTVTGHAWVDLAIA